MNRKQSSLNLFIFWLFPLLCVASIFAPLLIGPKAVYWWAVSPRGFLENSPTLFLFIGVCHCISMLCRKDVWRDKSVRGWIIAFILASIYFSGEDLNWGQYWLNLDVPQYFVENNGEPEINLHNMTTWLNQKPRLIMQIWAIIACVLVPMGWEWPKKITRTFVPPVFWPHTKNFLFTVGLALIVGLLDKIDPVSIPLRENTGIRFSEIQEMLMAYLMMLYAADLKNRIVSPRTSA
jgi:hypothetical protein